MVDFVTKLSWWSTCLILVGLGSTRASAQAPAWRAGMARVDTTPAVPVRMAGYASRTSPSQGVAHPLAAKAPQVASSDSSSRIATLLNRPSKKKPRVLS